MAARLALICWLAFSLKLWVVIEQPAGSCLWDYGRFQELAASFDVWRHSVFMQNYGGPTAKPTWLWSNRKFIAEIDSYASQPQQQQQQQSLVQVWEGHDGKRKFRGNSATKGSQEYPIGFGVAVAKLYSKHDGTLKQQAHEWHRAVEISMIDNVDLAKLVCTVVSHVRGGWADALLDGVFVHLEHSS